MRAIILRLSPFQSTALSCVYAHWSETNEGSIETMLYAEIFRRKAAEYRHMLSKFENDGGETRQVPVKWGDPISSKRDIHLTSQLVDWESQRAAREQPADTTDTPNSTDELKIPFPGRVLDRIERGLALRQAWSRVWGPDAPVKLYASFEEWAIEQLMEYVQRELNRIEDEEAAKEEEELYPDIAANQNPHGESPHQLMEPTGAAVGQKRSGRVSLPKRTATGKPNRFATVARFDNER